LKESCFHCFSLNTEVDILQMIFGECSIEGTLCLMRQPLVFLLISGLYKYNSYQLMIRFNAVYRFVLPVAHIISCCRTCAEVATHSRTRLYQRFNTWTPPFWYKLEMFRLTSTGLSCLGSSLGHSSHGTFKSPSTRRWEIQQIYCG